VVDDGRRERLARVTVTLAGRPGRGAPTSGARAADSATVAVRGPDE
jgi:hypothetical protein